MRSKYLISSILQGKWLIDFGFAISMGPAVSNLLNQYVDFEKQEPDKLLAFAITPDAAVKTAKYSYWDGFERAPAGSVAVIKISGPLMKEDQWCGPAGTATIGEIIKAAAATENIDGIVLHIDSPGGTVDGTEVLGNIVKSVEKPVITFVDGLMASAAFWIGSNADEIIASTELDEIGSVGVLMSFADMQPFWEKQGVVFRTVTATTSPDKVKLWEDIRLGKKEAIDQYRKEVLDPIDEKFMNTIRENLPDIKDEYLTGKIYFARDLMGTVVKSIGTLDDAINRASELGKERNSKKEGGNSALEEQKTVAEVAEEFEIKLETIEVEKEITLKINKNMKQFARVNTALGVESLESVDEFVSLDEEQLEALDNALAADKSEELQGQLNAANEKVGTLESTISDKDATIAKKDDELAEKDAEIDRLKGKADDTITTAKTDGDDKDLKKGQAKTVVNDQMDFSEQVNAVKEEYLPNY